MRLALAILVLASCGRLRFDDTPISWSARFGGAFDDSMTFFGIDAADDVVVGGEFYRAIDFAGVLTSPDSGTMPGRGAFVGKLDGHDGHALWSRHLADEAYVGPQGIAVGVDLDIWVTGWAFSTIDFGSGPVPVNGFPDAYVVKLSPDGDRLFGAQLGDANSQLGMGVLASADGGVYVYGFFNGGIDFGPPCAPIGSAINETIYLARLSADGTCMWAKQFGSGGQQIPISLAIDPAGNLALSGSFTGTLAFGGTAVPIVVGGPPGHAFVAVLDPNAVGVSALDIGPIPTGYISAAFAPSGSIYIGGSLPQPLPFDTTSSPQGGLDLVIGEVDATGQPVWARLYGGPGDDIGRLFLLPTGDLALVGSLDSPANLGGHVIVSAGGSDALLVRMRPDGEIADAATYGDAMTQLMTCVDLGSVGQRIVAGAFAGTIDLGSGILDSEGGLDLFVARLAP